MTLGVFVPGGWLALSESLQWAGYTERLLQWLSDIVKRIERSALITYSDRHMFDLVNDIEAYPSFMNGCVGAQVLERSDEELIARLDLSRMGFKHSFTTRNRLQAPTLMTMELVEGPFLNLMGEWRFKALSSTASKVGFSVEFELDNKLVSGAVGKVFEQVANEMVDGICARARNLYA